MSTISSSVGLISGLPIQDLVDSLIQVQSGPLNQLRNRLGVLTSRRTALLQLSAQILSIRNTAAKFNSRSFFDSATVQSSDESVLLASVSGSAAPGEYTFSVRNLASAHQLMSAGFVSADDTPVGAGTLTLERAAARVNRSTGLDELNGGQGVQVGRIRVTDRSGGTAEIDLLGAKTIDDVVRAINTETQVQVEARVEGDHLVLEDRSGGTGSLTVAEVGGGRTARDLGILQSVATGDLVGVDLVAVSDRTLLSRLNDGNGIRTHPNGVDDFQVSLAGGEQLSFNLSNELRQQTPLALINHGNGVPAGTIRITDRSGGTAEIDLSGASTVQDVLDAINNAAGVDVTVTRSGTRLIVTDNSIADGATAANDLLIEDVDSTTAEALGLATSTSGNQITGASIYAVDTLGDVLNIINLDPANAGRLTASISPDGRGITLTDNTTGTGPFAVTALDGGTGVFSKAAEDLGLLGTGTGGTLTSRRLLAGLNTVLLRSLNGGTGVDLTDLQVQDRSGTTLQSIDLSGAVTLSDVIDAINAAPTSIVASVSASGLGIELVDTSGGSGNLIVTGATADSLGIAIDAAADRVVNGNLQRRYISEASRRQDLNHGDGIPLGKFRITDSNGQSAVVDLTQGDNEETLQAIIQEINSRPIDVVARINDTGDGLLLEDTGGGPGLLSVAEEGGTVARDLGILGQAEEGETFIDGSFERRIDIGPNDSLNDVLKTIRDSGAEVNASIINDGSGGQPFRLSLTSVRSGRAGALAIDAGATGLAFNTLAEARDATVVFGSPDAGTPLVLSSATNTLSDVIDGVRFDLISAGNQSVTISVRRDEEAIVQQVQDLVNGFNAVIDTLDNLTRFDPETEIRGILQGDSTARRVRQVLVGLTNKTVPGLPSSFNRLSSVGVTLGSGSKLKLDEEKLREALTNDPDAVAELFTLNETDSEGEVVRTGLGGILEAEIDRLTDEETGIIPLREEALLSTEDQLNGRIDQLQVLLDRRRERLLAQFNTMETVLAGLQSQQSALSALVSLTPGAFG